MRILFGLTIVVTLVFLASSKQFYGIRRTRLGAAFTTGGWMMVLIGLLLGPHISALVTKDQFYVLQPLVYFLLGWAGLVIGLQIDKRIISVIPKPVLKLSLNDFIPCIFITIIGLTIFLYYWMDQQIYPAIFISTVIAATLIGWSPEVRSLHIGRPDQQPIALAIRAVAGIGSIASVLLFGFATILFTATNQSPTELTQIAPMAPLEILAITLDSPAQMALDFILAIIVGIVMGLVGYWLIDIASNKNEGEFLVVLVGVVSFSAGAAATMGVASILVGMVTGIVLANLPERALIRFKRVLVDAEQPVGMGIMLSAGLFADPLIGKLGIAIVIIIVLLRLLLKRIHVARNFKAVVNCPVSPTILNGLIRQNPLAIVIVIGFAISPMSHANPYLNGEQLLFCIILVGIFCEVWPLLTSDQPQPANVSSAVPTPPAPPTTPPASPPSDTDTTQEDSA